MAEKKFIGSGKSKKFNNGGMVINCIVELEGKKHFFVVGTRRTPSEKGYDFYVAIDEYNRDRSQSNENSAPSSEPQTEQQPPAEPDLPF